MSSLLLVRMLLVSVCDEGDCATDKHVLPAASRLGNSCPCMCSCCSDVAAASTAGTAGKQLLDRSSFVRFSLHAVTPNLQP